MSDPSKQYDLKKICRICLKYRNNIISITSYNILNMIRACASIKISESDKLPQQICLTCFINLKNAYSFKQQCETSDKELREKIIKDRLNPEENIDKNKLSEISEKIDISEDYEREKVLDVNKKGGCSKESDYDAASGEKEQKIKTRNKIDISDGDEDEDEETLDVYESGEPNAESDYDAENDGNKEQKIKQINPNENKNVSVKINNPSESTNTLKINNCTNSNSIKTNTTVPCISSVYKYACDDCPCRFEFTHLLGKHMRKYHFVKPIKCNNCLKEFYHPLHLEDHNRSVHQPKTFTCDTCSKTYAQIESLEIHKLVVHMGQLPFSCTECDAKFESKSAVKRHIFDVHKIGTNPRVLVTCPICNRTLDRAAIKKHNLTHMTNRPKNICEICHKNFSSKSALDEHIKIIHKKLRKFKYSCSICNKNFARPSGLKAHMVTHTGEKAYKCEKCDKQFSRQTALKTHVVRTHLNLRNFECQICTQKFFDRTSLENHLRTHTGEKPFKCLVCDKNFSFKSALITHNKNVHKK